LVERFTLQGAHKPYEPDKRKANNGTCEFRSRDAHIGVISRRSDIESLGYNLILWFYGRHPWANQLKDTEKVLAKKNWAMSNIDDFLKEAFSGKTFVDDEETNDSKASKTASSKSKSNGKKTPSVQQQQVKSNMPISTIVPKGFKNFFGEINQLSHDARPNYGRYKNILQEIARLNPKTAHPNNDSPKRSRASRLINNKKQQHEESIDSKKSNIKNSHINGNSEWPSNTESDDTEIEEEAIDTRIKSPRTTRTQTSKANEKLSPTKRTKQLKNKNKIIPETPQTPKATLIQSKNLRNRKNLFDNGHADGDQLDSINGMKTLNLSRRYSTPLISLAPFD
ncbi:hypothetical protein BLA29_008069, partial [Euroglyphus maynei]